MGHKKINMIGQRFGKLVVLAESTPLKPDGRAYWLCQCDCGNTKTISGKELRNGSNVTCAACNRYYFESDRGYCVVSNGKEFIFDLSDLEVVQAHIWHVDKSGYVWTHTPRMTSLHRLLMQPQGDEEIDHINHDPSDCRRVNMRYASRQQNGSNLIRGRNNCSGYKGVGWHKGMKRHRAYITVYGRHKHLGYFTTPQEAAIAYNNAASFYFGEFAKLNEVEVYSENKQILELGA